MNISGLLDDISIEEQIVDKVLSDEMLIVINSAIILLILGLIFTLD